MKSETCREYAEDSVSIFLEFIKNNKNISEPVSKNIPYFYNEYKIIGLFEENEKIVTDANEVPTNDERVWRYNGHYTYDFFYALLDNNQLLVVFVEGRLETCEPSNLWFYLYPNADKLSVFLMPSHDNKPYFNLLDEKGQLVNSFPYERIHDYKEYVNGIKLKDLVSSVDRCTIEERFQNRNQLVR